MPEHVCTPPQQDRCLVVGLRWRCPVETCHRLWMAVNVTDVGCIRQAQWVEVQS